MSKNKLRCRVKAEVVEVGGEVLEEVALEGVVAVAVHHLVTEGVGIELQIGLNFLLNVDILGVEFVLLGRFRGGESLIQRVSRHSSQSPSPCALFVFRANW